LTNAEDVPDMTVSDSGQCWFIDLDWFSRHNRSFAAIAWECLCPACRRQRVVTLGEGMAAELLTALKDCCAQQSDFITRELPIRQSVFRLLLASGNQPIELERLVQQLNELYGGYKISTENLRRLLKSDTFYGLCEVG
jgi:hypothetical protein